MNKIIEKINNFKNYICDLSSKKWFYEIYCAILCFISIIAWSLLGSVGMALIMVIAGISLYLMDDIKYVLPVLINFIFVNSSGFELNKFPTMLVISAIILIAALIFYVIKNRKKYTKGDFGNNFILFAIFSFIPIFWNDSIDSNNTVMYIMYLGWLLYFFIYFFVLNNVKGNILEELCIMMSYLGVLLAFECIIQALRDLSTIESVFDLYLQLGWGIGNEAGIMILVVMPFTFYQLSKSELKTSFIYIVKILLMCVAIVFTTSRASYLVGAIEFGMLFLLLFYYSKYKKIILLSGIIAIAIISLVLIVDGDIISNLMSKVFKLKLTGNGREEIWNGAIEIFKSSNLYKIFGKGVVAEFDSSNRMIVYHSTFLHTLATMGIIGVVLLICHFIRKYAYIFIYKSQFSLFLLVGYFCVDVYGMVDNTYHMYYYMIVLCVIFGVLEGIRNWSVNNDEGAAVLRVSENA